MSTIKVKYDPIMRGTPVREPAIAVYVGDMFAHSQHLASTGKRIAIHNFANNYSPGLVKINSDGTHRWSYNTQEEQLLRASTICDKAFLPLNLYPIRTDVPATLFTKNVLFHRRPRSGISLPFAQHYQADVITCAAIQDPLLDRASGAYLPEVEKDVIEAMILVLTLAKDADVFVTGLWGCGAFNHPITASLKAWKHAIKFTINPPAEIHFCYMKDGLTRLMTAEENSPNIVKSILQN